VGIVAPQDVQNAALASLLALQRAHERLSAGAFEVPFIKCLQ